MRTEKTGNWKIAARKANDERDTHCCLACTRIFEGKAGQVYLLFSKTNRVLGSLCWSCVDLLRGHGLPALQERVLRNLGSLKGRISRMEAVLIHGIELLEIERAPDVPQGAIGADEVVALRELFSPSTPSDN